MKQGRVKTAARSTHLSADRLVLVALHVSAAIETASFASPTFHMSLPTRQTCGANISIARNHVPHGACVPSSPRPQSSHQYDRLARNFACVPSRDGDGLWRRVSSRRMYDPVTCADNKIPSCQRSSDMYRMRGRASPLIPELNSPNRLMVRNLQRPQNSDQLDSIWSLASKRPRSKTLAALQMIDCPVNV